jgi:hypothetical protein
MDIKIILSTPSTISRKVSVSRLAHAEVCIKTVKSNFILSAKVAFLKEYLPDVLAVKPLSFGEGLG